ncbi:hypothetical protein T4D_17201 [Trichinella pseudospiralis]|uniref:Uncharacterized protein n=1 Tax=Trichinella pseudospiralis TaxID=6337 RepID=A0A0V1FGI9_TRIPS|nr:hypothetical protein T4D_17201 [Trichinella pseudospiralis]
MQIESINITEKCIKEGLLGIILLRCLIIAAVPNKNWLKIIFIKKAVTERVFALMTWLIAAIDNVHLMSFIWREFEHLS